MSDLIYKVGDVERVANAVRCLALTARSLGNG
jgi:hypothetical protein